jgi:hypothetical protein
MNPITTLLKTGHIAAASPIFGRVVIVIPARASRTWRLQLPFARIRFEASAMAVA